MTWKLGRRVFAAGLLTMSAVGVAEPWPSAADTNFPSAAGDSEPLNAAGVVEALQRDGEPVPNPIDTTAQECPNAGCRHAVVTDTLRIKSFATFSQAQWYAMTHGLPRFATIVVEFAPPLSPRQRDDYLSAMQRLVP